MSKQLEILNKIENGEISPEEGAKLLSQLSDEENNPSGEQNEVLEDMSILEMIEQGKISADEGIKLIGSQNTERGDVGGGSEKAEKTTESEPPRISEQEIAKWKRWWQIPLYLGAAVTGFSALWMNKAFQSSPYGFWFFCAMIPLLVGLLLVFLSWSSRSGTWLHVRVKQNQGGPQRISLSFPLPIKFSAWALRNFGHLIPGLENTSLDELILALETTTKGETPLYVTVDEDDATQVEVFIG